MKPVTIEETQKAIDWGMKMFGEPTEDSGWWWSLYRMASEVIKLKQENDDLKTTNSSLCSTIRTLETRYEIKSDEANTYHEWWKRACTLLEDYKKNKPKTHAQMLSESFDILKDIKE